MLTLNTQCGQKGRLNMFWYPSQSAGKCDQSCKMRNQNRVEVVNDSEPPQQRVLSRPAAFLSARIAVQTAVALRCTFTSRRRVKRVIVGDRMCLSQYLKGQLLKGWMIISFDSFAFDFFIEFQLEYVSFFNNKDQFNTFTFWIKHHLSSDLTDGQHRWQLDAIILYFQMKYM